VVALAAAAAYFYLAGSRKTAIDSIAVLPFVNASADPDTEYLSDGITESLINSLSQLPNMKMIARSSVFRYKGREMDPRVIGRELGVRAVLTGRVTQRGDKLLVSAELVDARDSRHLWGEQYNRKLSDILAVQGEISREISKGLRLRLTGGEQRQLTKRYTDNIEAYRAYLRGRYFWNKRSREGFEKAIEYFGQAIAIDPNYALPGERRGGESVGDR
jgi:serine/threonine-protein kinase